MSKQFRVIQPSKMLITSYLRLQETHRKSQEKRLKESKANPNNTAKQRKLPNK